MVNQLDMKARRPLDEWESMMDRAQDVLPDDDIALKLSSFLKPMDTGPIGFLTMSCLNLREVADTLAQFYPILNNVYRAHVRMVEDRLCTSLIPRGDRRSPWIEKITMGTLCSNNRWVSGCHDLRFDARFAFPPPAPKHRAGFDQVFGGDLAFGADQSEVLRPPGVHELRVSHGGHGVWGSVRNQLLAELADVENDSGGLIKQVEDLVKSRLERGELRIEDVSAALHVSVRTLQAKMAEHGESFRVLSDRVRHAMALEYILDAGMPLVDLADKLGFASQASLNRAFQRWVGMTPGQYRKLRLRSLKEIKDAPGAPGAPDVEK